MPASENNKELIQNNSIEEVLEFPEGFLWGTSTSAYQVEGGITNDWSEWEKSEERIVSLQKKGLNPDDFSCGQACDSYHLYKEDLKCAQDLNTNAIRFGIEWARIEPNKDTWDVREIDHYLDVMKEAKKNGFKVVCTLWHWTNPVWFAQEGGWSNKKSIYYFERYVDLIVKEMGSYVDYWVTLNEPLVHVANGYITGRFPPNKRNIFKADKVFNNLVDAHNKAYDLIHNHYPDSQVSITGLLNYYEPANRWNPIEIGISKIAHYFANHRFLKKIEKKIDYIGFDYYFHDRIVWHPPFKKNKNVEVNDMGWEIFPEGIYHVLKYLHSFKKPIIVLENGIPDAEDSKRVEFIREHIYYVYQAMSEGVDVRGYFYWSLLDNFEWADGFGPKFGLYSVDKNTRTRKMKASAQVYADICKNNGAKWKV